MQPALSSKVADHERIVRRGLVRVTESYTMLSDFTGVHRGPRHILYFSGFHIKQNEIWIQSPMYAGPQME